MTLIKAAINNALDYDYLHLISNADVPIKPWSSFETTEIKWDAEAAEKAGFEHFMIKEIHEQPKAVEDTLNSVVRDGCLDFSVVGLTEEQMKAISQIYIVACGSAWHVGMAAQYEFKSTQGVRHY